MPTWPQLSDTVARVPDVIGTLAGLSPEAITNATTLGEDESRTEGSNASSLFPVRLRGRIEDKGGDWQVIGTPGLTCEGMHHRGILEHLLQGVLPFVSKARTL